MIARQRAKRLVEEFSKSYPQTGKEEALKHAKGMLEICKIGISKRLGGNEDAKQWEDIIYELENFNEGFSDGEKKLILDLILRYDLKENSHILGKLSLDALKTYPKNPL